MKEKEKEKKLELVLGRELTPKEKKVHRRIFSGELSIKKGFLLLINQ